MAEDKAKISPDEAGGNNSKVFSFVWKAFRFDQASIHTGDPSYWMVTFPTV